MLGALAARLAASSNWACPQAIRRGPSWTKNENISSFYVILGQLIYVHILSYLQKPCASCWGFLFIFSPADTPPALQEQQEKRLQRNRSRSRDDRVVAAKLVHTKWHLRMLFCKSYLVTHIWHLMLLTYFLFLTFPTTTSRIVQPLDLVSVVLVFYRRTTVDMQMIRLVGHLTLRSQCRWSPPRQRRKRRKKKHALPVTCAGLRCLWCMKADCNISYSIFTYKINEWINIYIYTILLHRSKILSERHQEYDTVLRRCRITVMDSRYMSHMLAHCQGTRQRSPMPSASSANGRAKVAKLPPKRQRQGRMPWWPMPQFCKPMIGWDMAHIGHMGKLGAHCKIWLFWAVQFDRKI